MLLEGVPEPESGAGELEPRVRERGDVLELGAVVEPEVVLAVVLAVVLGPEVVLERGFAVEPEVVLEPGVAPELEVVLEPGVVAELGVGFEPGAGPGSGSALEFVSARELGSVLELESARELGAVRELGSVRKLGAGSEIGMGFEIELESDIGMGVEIEVGSGLGSVLEPGVAPELEVVSEQPGTVLGPAFVPGSKAVPGPSHGREAAELPERGEVPDSRAPAGCTGSTPARTCRRDEGPFCTFSSDPCYALCQPKEGCWRLGSD